MRCDEEKGLILIPVSLICMFSVTCEFLPDHHPHYTHDDIEMATFNVNNALDTLLKNPTKLLPADATSLGGGP